MSDERNDGAERAMDLRREFDGLFAQAPVVVREELENLLAFRIADDHFAIRLLEIQGLVKTPRIVPVPSSVTALVGLAGIRGELIPVYSLPVLLGYSSSEEPRWILLCSGPFRAGLSITELTNCFKVPMSAFSVTAEAPGTARSGEAVSINGAVHTVVRISTISALIENQ